MVLWLGVSSYSCVLLCVVVVEADATPSRSKKKRTNSTSDSAKAAATDTGLFFLTPTERKRQIAAAMRLEAQRKMQLQLEQARRDSRMFKGSAAANPFFQKKKGTRRQDTTAARVESTSARASRQTWRMTLFPTAPCHVPALAAPAATSSPHLQTRARAHARAPSVAPVAAALDVPAAEGCRGLLARVDVARTAAAFAACPALSRGAAHPHPRKRTRERMGAWGREQLTQAVSDDAVSKLAAVLAARHHHIRPAAVVAKWLRWALACRFCDAARYGFSQLWTETYKPQDAEQVGTPQSLWEGRTFRFFPAC